MSVFVVESPSIEPVSLMELRKHCRIDEDYDDEDDLLRAFISSAREYCENFTGRNFAEKTLGFTGNFPEGLKALELSPDLNEVLFVEYTNRNGQNVSISLDELFIDSSSIYGTITPKGIWPSTQNKHPKPVTIHFECGGGNCPLAAKQSILLLASHWYQNREASTIGATSKESEYSVHSLLCSLRVINV